MASIFSAFFKMQKFYIGLNVIRVELLRETGCKNRKKIDIILGLLVLTLCIV
jgi:hypothetical protein